MFDSNLKPLPGFASVSSYLGAGQLRTNPMIASTPTVIRNETVRNSRVNPPVSGGFTLGGTSSLFLDNSQYIDTKSVPVMVASTSETIYQELKSNDIENNINNNENNININDGNITIENMEWARSLFSEIKVNKNSEGEIIVVIKDKKAKEEFGKVKQFAEYSEITLSDNTHNDRIVRTGVERNGNIVSEIIISSNSTVLFSLTTTIDTILELESAFNKGGQGIQFNFETFNYHSIAIYFAIAKAYNDLTEVKEQPSQKNSNTPLAKKSKSAEILGNPPTPKCLTHDYKCTSPASDKVHVDFLWCGFDVDLSECCKQHDIDLWCGAGLPNGYVENVLFYDIYYKWFTLVNAKFAACVTGKFISSANNLPWYCGGSVGGFIIGFITGVIAGVLHFLGVQLGGVGNILNLSTYMPWDGRNRRSCLCGGDEPTTLCADGCRDLCTERGLKQNCTDCYWRCEGQGIGKSPLAKLFPFSGVDESKCCPKTREGCLKKIDCGKDRCFNCRHVCEIYPNGSKSLDIITSSSTQVNLPCCSGTPDLASREEAEKKCGFKGMRGRR